MTYKYAAMNLGKGVERKYLEQTLDTGVEFVGSDSGSNDVGPFMLANQGMMFSVDNYERDMRTFFPMLRAANVPYLTGSAGGGGSNWGVDCFADLAEKALADAQPGRVARIYSELDPEYVLGKLRDGRLHPLADAPPYTEADILRSERIVAVLGPEPFQRAVERGGDIVIAGRSSDSSIFAALPMVSGVSAATSYGAARIAECGTVVCDPPRMGVLGIDLDDDWFEVHALSDTRCTAQSVGQHQLYEQGDPFRRPEPPGVLVLNDVTYSDQGDGRVRVAGNQWESAEQYTLKLEGIERAGFQTVAMVSIADPAVLADFDFWLEGMVEEVWRRTEAVYGDEARSRIALTVRAYGRDGTLGDLAPSRAVDPSEILLVATSVCSEKEVAHAHAKNFWHSSTHHPSRNRSGFLNMAWPLSPPVVDTGPVYRFNTHHVIEVDDPFEACRIVVGES